MTHTEMTMRRMMNFDKFAVGYINDNVDYINNAQEAVEHITENIKYDETATPLTDKELERFKYVAETLFKQGYVAHAGVLHADLDEIEGSEEQYVTVATIHTKGYDYDDNEFCIGVDGINLDGEKVENLYLFFSDAEMEEIISSYKEYKKRK